METAAITQGATGHSFSRLGSTWVRSVSPSTEALLAALENVALSGAPVLIMGESGTGKRALAAEIHRISGKTEQNLREVDCVAANVDLNLQVEAIDGSTVFFRNVAELSAAQQLKALQAFFNGKHNNSGSSTVRVIASSLRSLDEDVRSGRFREDLYYRISSFCLCVPPLRQRKEDIPILAKYFANKYSTLLGRPFEMSAPVLKLLSGHSWPGNIRELEHVVRTIVAVGDENIVLAIIRASGLKGISRDSRLESLSLKQAARDASRRAERELILDTLSRTHWNRKRAARELQISYKALLYKLKQIGIDDDNTLGVEA